MTWGLIKTFFFVLPIPINGLTIVETFVRFMCDCSISTSMELINKLYTDFFYAIHMGISVTNKCQNKSKYQRAYSNYE